MTKKTSLLSAFVVLAAMIPPTRMLALRNGGVSVTGWNNNEIVVKTRIRAKGRSMSEAKALAGQVRTVITGSTVSVDGPNKYDDDDHQWSASLIASIPTRSNLRVETRNGPVSVSMSPM